MIDLGTLRTTPLAEARPVDDQVEWLDDSAILYAIPDRSAPTPLVTDVWTVPADGSGEPELLLRGAASPAVLRSVTHPPVGSDPQGTHAPVQTSEAQLPWEMKCVGAVRDTLAEWHTTGEVFRDAEGPYGDRVWRLPTDRLGTWAAVSVDPQLTPTLARIDARDTLRISFGPLCEPRRSVQRHTDAVSDGAFDDVSVLVGDGRPGVIYIWSPHMPLSVDASQHVTRASEALGVTMTGLVDPAADIDYARSVAASAGIATRALRPFRSVELIFRNATLHAPSLLVYDRGRLIGLAVPGYRDEAGYRALIQTRLEGAVDTLVPDP